MYPVVPADPRTSVPILFQPAVVTVTASPFDAPLSALRNRVEDLAVVLAIWENRTEPDAHARRCASDAVDAIDAVIRQLHLVRGQLISEIRASDDASSGTG